MTTPLFVTRSSSARVAWLFAALTLSAAPVLALDIMVKGDGAPAAPALKAAPAGAEAGTFFDVSLAAANSSGSALSANNSGDELSLGGGCFGTTSGFSINKLILNGSNLSGAVFSNPRLDADAKTLHLGVGGLTVKGGVYSVLGGNLVLDVGDTSQNWVTGSGSLTVFSNVTGKGVIHLSGGTVNLRNSTSFAGVWMVEAGAMLIIWNNHALGSQNSVTPTGRVLLDGGTLRGNFDKNIYAHEIGVGSKGGVLMTSANCSTTLNGRIVNQAGVATAPLKVVAHGNGKASNLILAGDLSGHVGPMVLGSESVGFILNFAPTSTLSFVLGANGVVDGVDATTTALLSAGGPTTATSVEFNGKFVVDLSQADTTAGNRWKLVESDKLNEIYGGSFRLVAASGGEFKKKGNQWVLTDRSQIWSYDPVTGILSLSVL